MKKKWLIIGIAILLVLTAVVAILHWGSQEEPACMVILQGETQIQVSFEDLGNAPFSGELIDGKGTVTAHEYTGILLKELLESKGIDTASLAGVTVTSADNYSVEFTPEEVLGDATLYIAVTADGKTIEGIDPGTNGVQMIIFGDENSRRCVRYAQRITLK